MAIEAIGGPDAARATDPDVAQATLIALGRGMLYALQNLTIATGDIEIGAVELKDATTANRAVIDSSGNQAVKDAALIALLPASLGAKLTAASLSATIATDDAVLGALTETAPATDTASSGHNGRLQRIAQRLTSLIALLPTALGQGTMAQSLRVVLPSDQSAVPTYNAGSATPPTVPSSSAYTQANISFSSSGENVAVAGVSAQTVKLYACALTFASPVDVTIKDAAGGNTLAVFQGVTFLTLDPFPNGSPLFVTATAGALIVSLSAAVACKGSIWHKQG